jgi:ubiquinone biosynthesis protein UbiJ
VAFKSLPFMQFAAQLKSVAAVPSAALSTLVSKSACLIINHLLTQHPEFKQRLVAEQGKVLRVSVEPVQMLFGIDHQGFFQAQVDEPNTTTQADTEISMQWADLVGVVRSPRSVVKKASIRGDLDFAQVLSHVFTNLSWDHEADLARVLGDVQAVWVVNGLSAVGTNVKDVLGRFKDNLRDYVVHEQAMTPTPSEFDAFRHDLAVLRDDLARLEKRITRLGAK